MTEPSAVAAAYLRAKTAGFGYSSEPLAGQLLATLSAAVRPGGRILELGTGAGAGLAWISHGLGDRRDVQVVSVECDEDLAAAVRDAGLPDRFEVLTGDAEALLPDLGTFDLIFADAPAGKWTGLDLTIAALADGGVLFVDDMDPGRYTEPEHVAIVAGIRRTLVEHDDLVTTDLPVGSGFILAVRR
ncbi:putative O-methyltransferase YrrM [Actinoplanes lutulentus]|uniref:Putative O-methyltransferase YrrM n=1 Tax=Actinoplanes lutulentus TaxID=1287878 RepID=A0A327ZGH8_9ACTN|nr:class I SAM-dependent methyltransferase [Actinoplanes lutulentus]MBB2947370.1 putative O-methyltransferase YrrM [Actinoplanes lutulentus]RAK36644.1 putative O-methyltransferase YrrM [Actinoplanes lutulentus]